MSESIYKAFRFRLYPNQEVQSIFNQWFGCCRKVFNVTLDESIKQYEAGNKNFVNRSSFCSMITKLKADGEHDYLKRVPIHTLQASVDNLLDSYDRFFDKHGGFPKFKSKHESKQSFTVRCSPSIIRNCRFDNTITYKSPEFGGVNLYGQMSLKQDAKEDGKETSSEVNRYYAVGMTGRFGAADVGATFAITDYANTEYSELAEDNGYALTGYYRHNLGEITPVIAVQWFDHAKQSRFDDDGKPVTLVSETAGADGFGVVGGATMEIGGGTAMMQVGYRRAEYSTPMFANGYNKAWDAVQTAVGYEYSLSKRTKVYGGAGYTWEEQHGVWTSDNRAAEVVTGMVHSF